MRFLAVFLFAILFSSPAYPGHEARREQHVRVYVIMGQGSYLTSGGMVNLAHRLSLVKGLKVSLHGWKYPGEIIKDLGNLPNQEPVVLIGYSLGGHSTTYIAAHTKRRIALAVAYDPSIYSAVQYPAGPNIGLMLVYHNNGPSRYGHAYIRGPQVKTTEINMSHLGVDWDEGLHQKTIAAVMKVLHGRSY